MTGIDRLSPSAPLAVADTGGRADARALAESAVGEIGHRVLAWVDASARGNGGGSAAWAGSAGAGGGFRPDAGELARGGDVYGLRDLAESIAAELGGTPTQEGELRRALEDFTRQSVIQVAGLAGAAGDRQVAGLRDALDAAGRPADGAGVDAVVARLEAATAQLAAQNGV